MLNCIQRNILQVLTRNGDTTARQLRDLLHVDLSIVEGELEELKNTGRILTVGRHYRKQPTNFNSELEG